MKVAVHLGTSLGWQKQRFHREERYGKKKKEKKAWS